MNQEIKSKLEQAADNYRGGDDFEIWTAFYAGAQNILENPAEWGLCSLEVLEATSVSVGKAWVDNERLKSQLAKYREVLERLLEENMCSHAGDELIEEALKQEE